MSDTRFSLRRPQPETAPDVEAYIDGGSAAPVPEEKLQRLVVMLPASSHRRFKQLAAAQGTSMSDLCRGWIEQALDTHFE